MAENGQGNGREALTKREREIIQELAREIVREAGTQRDSQDEALRDSDSAKIYVDVLKHAGTLSGAAAVGVSALHKDLGLGGVSTVLSLALVGASFLLALFGLSAVTERLNPHFANGRDQDAWPSNLIFKLFPADPVRFGSRFAKLSYILLVLGITIFAMGSLVRL